MKKKRSPRRIRTLSAICLLVLPLIMGCGSGSEELQESPQDAVPVETQVASATPYSQRITCTGTLSGIREATVSSQLAAEVRHVAVALGDNVGAGELLVQLDDDIYRDRLRQAEAGLLSAEAAWELARSDLGRHEELFEKGHLSQGEVEAFRARAKAAEADHLGAKAALESAQHQFRDTRIVSPIGGRVSAVFVELGETVGPGSPVAVVVQMDSVEVAAGLPEEDVVRASPGMKADVRVAALGEQVFPGRVAAVGPMARMDTGTFPVEIHLANPDHRLLPGMVARVELVSEATLSIIWVPRDAVVRQYGQPVLFVVEDGKATRRSVSLGMEEEGGVEVTEGLDPGDEVVVLGQNNLQNGTPVVVRGKAS
jgi:RND family efflux transporter MFP subunit